MKDIHKIVQATNTVITLNLKTMGFNLNKNLYVFKRKTSDGFEYETRKFEEYADSKDAVIDAKARLALKIDRFKSKFFNKARNKL